MIEIEGLELANVLYFKSVKASLNKNSLTFVRGLNTDGDPANPTGNGAGKSLLFSTIPNVCYFAPPLAIKKKSSKEILKKNSSITLKLKVPSGNRYAITQTSTNYKILENGVDLKVRTKPLAEKFIRNIFPLSEIEYYTHGFVSTQRPFLMQTDSNVNRLEHLSSIFRLDSYGELRQYFAIQLRSLKDNDIKLSVLEQKSLSLREKLAKVEKGIFPKRLRKAKTDHTALDSVIQEYVQREFEILKDLQSLKTLLTTEEELDELRSHYSFKDHPGKRLPWLKTQRATARAMGEYKALLKAYKQNIEATQVKLKQLELPLRSRKMLQADKVDLEAKIEHLEEYIAAKEVLRREHRRLTAAAAPLVTTLKDEHDLDARVDLIDLDIDYSGDIAILKASLKLEALIQHQHEETQASICPTCLSDVDVDNIKQIVSRAKVSLPLLERKAEAQSLYKKLSGLRDTVLALKFKPKVLEAKKASLEDLSLSLKEVEKFLEIWKKVAYLKKALSDIEAPVPPEVLPETDLTYEQLDTQIDLCTEILKHLQAKTKLIENNPLLSGSRTVKAVRTLIRDNEEQLTLVTGALKDQRTGLGELSLFIERQTNLIAEKNLYASELAETLLAIEAIGSSADDKQILDVLLRAYSSKGLKTLVAGQICALLESNLNFYRGLIFVEPFSFSVTATEAGLAINVDRGNGMVSDVRNLSGAESNCFRLLFIISLLPLIPSDRRLNMIVLDEPTSHMHSVTRQIFVERFLPALQDVIPHIYVITPHDDDYLTGSNEWIIAKSDGVSTLIAG